MGEGQPGIGGAAIPLHRQRQVLSDPEAHLVHVAKVVLAIDIPEVCGLLVPVHGLRVVLGHAGAVVVEHADAVRGVVRSLVGRLAVPAERLVVGLVGAATDLEQVGEQRLAVDEAFLGQRPCDRIGLVVVAGIEGGIGRIAALGLGLRYLLALQLLRVRLRRYRTERNRDDGHAEEPA